MNVAPLQFLLLVLVGWANRGQLEVVDYLKEENRILREQLRGRRMRLTDDQRRRLDDGTARRGAGRPRTRQRVQDLVVRFATENPGWGYTRIRGALANLGHEVGRNTIKRILLDHGLKPAPTRGKRMPWRTFVQAHLGVIAAMDFFTVEVLTFGGLVRYFVLFVIDLGTRRVKIAGIARQPHGAWMKQVARNLTDGVDGFLKSMRYVIFDRDPLFTDEFRRILRDAGVEPVKLPAQSPT